MTDITINGHLGARRHSRFDQDFVELLRADLLKRDPVLRSAKYLTNGTLNRHAGRLRYIERQNGDGGQAYHLISVEGTPELFAVIDRARDGASYSELVDAVRAVSPDVSREVAEEFVLDAAHAQVVDPEVGLRLSGRESVYQLLECMEGLDDLRSQARVLRDALTSLEAMDSEGTGVSPANYEAVAASLATLPVTVDPARLFQVDLIPSVEGAVGEGLVRELIGTVEFLAKSAPPWPDPFAEFKERFTRRYEAALVPLLEVIDGESGIGFGRAADDFEPLLAGLALRDEARREQAGLGRRERFLIHQLQRCWSDGSMELRLTDDAAAELGSGTSGLPHAFAIVASIGRRANEPFAFVKAATGPSGARLLGRFCFGDDELRAGVIAHLRAEEALQPDVMFAEVLHLPNGRMGNVQARPSLRRHEIPVLCDGERRGEGRIVPSDLLVTVRDGRVVLFSRTHNCEVVPRMSTAHNHRRGLGLYHFLCAIQNQDCHEGVNWTWGSLNECDFLPRVLHGRVIVARAQWTLRGEVVANVFGARGESLWQAVQKWRTKTRAPRWLLLIDGDSELPIDLDNPCSIEMLGDLVRGRTSVHLCEAIPGPDESAATGAEGRYANEVVIPCVSNAVTSRRAGRVPRIPATDRVCPPGANWLFFKIYGGPVVIDDLVRGEVTRLAAKLCESRIIDNWFFLRYGDPDWHLRIRLQGPPDALMDDALPAMTRLLNRLSSSGVISHWSIDTYVREIDRYGGDEGLRLSEAIFGIDSQCSAELLQDPELGEPSRRWLVCLASLGCLAEDFAITQSETLEFLTARRDALGTFFKADKTCRRSLGLRYRASRREIDAAMSPVDPTLAKVLAKRSVLLSPLISALRKCGARGDLTIGLAEVAGSHLHMHTNRMCRSAGQKYEFVLSDFLVQRVRSTMAQARSN